jgi:Flp pilus assembly protein TadD
MVWLAWRKSEPALWVLGFFVLISPSSSIVPVVDLMFEHRSYLPVALLAIASTLAAQRIPRPMSIVLATSILVSLFVATVARNRTWRDEESLWTDVIAKSPRKARGYFQLAQAEISNRPDRARALYERGLELEPGSPIGHTNLGLLLLSTGQAEEALSHLRHALVLGGDEPLLWNNIGAAELRLGEIDEGEHAFRKALELAPCRFDARLNLIRTLAYLGKKDAALLVSQIPPACALLPDQSTQIEIERRSLN